MEKITQVVVVAVILSVLSETVDGRKKYYPEPGEGCKKDFFLKGEYVNFDLVEVCLECSKGFFNDDPRGVRCHRIKKKKPTITNTTTTIAPILTTTCLTTTTAQVLSTTPTTAATTSTPTTEAPTTTIPRTTAYMEATGKTSPQPTKAIQKLPESTVDIGLIIMGVIIAILLVALITLVVIYFKYVRSKGSKRDDEKSSVAYASRDIHSDSAQPLVDAAPGNTTPIN